MTTQVVRLTPAQAAKLARAADALGWTHEAIIREALKTFLRAMDEANT